MSCPWTHKSPSWEGHAEENIRQIKWWRLRTEPVFITVTPLKSRCIIHEINQIAVLIGSGIENHCELRVGLTGCIYWLISEVKTLQPILSDHRIVTRAVVAAVVFHITEDAGEDGLLKCPLHRPMRHPEQRIQSYFREWTSKAIWYKNMSRKVG